MGVGVLYNEKRKDILISKLFYAFLYYEFNQILLKNQEQSYNQQINCLYLQGSFLKGTSATQMTHAFF
jgi:hypothetical protein